MDQTLGERAVIAICRRAENPKADSKAKPRFPDKQSNQVWWRGDLPLRRFVEEKVDDLFLRGRGKFQNIKAFPQWWDQFGEPILHDRCEQDAVEVLDEFQQWFLRELFVQMVDLIQKSATSLSKTCSCMMLMISGLPMVVQSYSNRRKGVPYPW